MMIIHIVVKELKLTNMDLLKIISQIFQLNYTMKPLQSTIFQIGDCLTIAEKFKEEFDENYILSKCRENKCSLRNINQRDHLILH